MSCDITWVPRQDPHWRHPVQGTDATRSVSFRGWHARALTVARSTLLFAVIGTFIYLVGVAVIMYAPRAA